MKTLTEFAVIHLKNAQAKADELTAAGKTAEELPAALGEALSIEGDKLKFLLAALEVYKVRSEGLKRVLVISVGENEKAPQGAEKHDEQFYLAEFFPVPVSSQKGRGDRRDERGGKGDRGGRGDRKGKRGQGRGRRDERSAGEKREPRAPRETKPLAPLKASRPFLKPRPDSVTQATESTAQQPQAAESASESSGANPES